MRYRNVTGAELEAPFVAVSRAAGLRRVHVRGTTLCREHNTLIGDLYAGVLVQDVPAQFRQIRHDEMEPDGLNPRLLSLVFVGGLCVWMTVIVLTLLMI